MKTVNLLFLWLMIIISCSNSNNESPVSNKLNDNLSTIKKDADISSNGRQNNFISVVRPENPVRTIIVGLEKADVQGYTSQAIQTAIDALHFLGGGIVKILPGNYEAVAPIKLYSNITLIGSGNSTVLKKSKGFRTRFVIDAGYGELQLTVADPSGFTPGMGILISDSDNFEAWDITTAVITAIKGNTIYIDNYLIRDYTAAKNGTVSNACSVISAVEADNVTIADLNIDGYRETNDFLDGCRGGGIYLHKVKGAMVQNVIVKKFNGDGISWQLTEEVTVRNCDVSSCSNSGLHPGSGSPLSVIDGNNCHDNDKFGLFICWRDRHGVVRNNLMVRNGESGISTGHMDTDMLFENNQISENGGDGVYFRKEIPANAPHRNIFKNNLIENNGMKNGGYGFNFASPAEGVILEENTIRNTKSSSQKAAVFMGKDALPVILRNNKINGHPEKEEVKI